MTKRQFLVFLVLLLLTLTSSAVAQAPVVAPQQPGPDGGLVHIVQYGDTLEGIMGAYAEYGVTMDQLRELNGWRFVPQFIYVDDPIVILPPGSTTPGTGLAAGNYLSGSAPVQPTAQPAASGGTTDTTQTTAPPTTTGTINTLTGFDIQAVSVVEPVTPFLPVVGQGVQAAAPATNTTPSTPEQTNPSDGEIDQAGTPIPAPTIPITPEPAATEEVSQAPPSDGGGSAELVLTQESSPTEDSISSGGGDSAENAAVATETEEVVEVAELPTETPTQLPTATATTAPTETSEVAAAVQVTEASSQVATIESTLTPTTQVTAEPTLGIEVAEVTDNQADEAITSDSNVPDLTTQTGTICVSLYVDANQNARRDADEALLADGEILVDLTNSQMTMADEPLCISDVPVGARSVSAVPPQGYGMTTPLSLQVQSIAGRVSEVSFGAAEGYIAPALPVTEEDAEAVGDAASDTSEVTDTTVAKDEDSLFDTLVDNSGYIALALAAVVFLFGIGLALVIRLWR